MGSHGVWSYTEIAEELGQSGLRRAVANGSLTRVGWGWYATAAASPTVVSAVRLGGRVGCLSALDLHGLWVPPDQRLHLAVAREVPPSLPAHVLVHRERAFAERDPVLALETALGQAVRHHDAETALIVLESAVNRGRLSEREARALVESVKPTARLMRHFSPLADSGTETRVRLFLVRRKVPVTPQFAVSGVGIVDLLLGNSLVIELDSLAHHTGRDNYSRDRVRDLELARRGFRVLRLTYQQVFFDWERTQEAISCLLRARIHRAYPKSVI